MPILWPFHSGNLFKTLLVFGMQGAHQSVPDGEVQAIVAPEVLMMHVVVGGGVDPFGQPTLVKTFREELIPHVSNHVFQHHEHGKCENGKDVNGKQEEKDEDDAKFNNCFQRVKAEGGPGGRID